MPTVAHANIPTPKSWDEFEDIVLSAAKLRWRTDDFARNGRQGQKQSGVDIFGSDREGRQIGVQAKNTTEGVPKKVIEMEIENAEAFKPKLDALYIATTADRDVNIQEIVRTLSVERRKAGKFTVSLLFWDEIAQDLALDEAVFFRHYPQFEQKSRRAIAHDRTLYERLLKLLTEVIEFIDSHNMAGFSYPDTTFEPLKEFYYEWHRPQNEFLNAEIEAAKKALWSKVDEYYGAIVDETYPLPGNARLQSVPAEWEFEQPERFQRAVERLHTLGSEVVEAHRQFVRTAKLEIFGDGGGVA